VSTLRKRPDTASYLEALKRVEMAQQLRAGLSVQYAEQVQAAKDKLEASLRAFVEAAWPLIEPAAPFVGGYHLDAICAHLEAVTRGDLKDLLINVPPRHSKSTIVSVMWPAWEWLRAPATRWLFAAYAMTLSTRDQLRCKRLIESWWYQGRWRDRFTILFGGRAAGVKFENNYTGYRMASSVGGSTTGEGGDRIVIDDPHNIQEAESATIRESTIHWWDRVITGRRNDPRRSSRVIIMQRVHDGDLAGHVQRQGGFTVLCLPTEYEPTTYVSPIGWQDPRTQTGELLHPERFGKKEVDQLKKELGSYAYAAQHQQRPAPAGGGVVKSWWWQYWRPRARDDLRPILVRDGDGLFQTRVPMALPALFDELLQSWDCAFKDLESSSYVVGQVWGRKGADRFLLDQIREHLDITGTISAIKALTGKWPTARRKLIEDKANGPAVIQLLRRKVGGLIAFNPNAYGPLIARAHAVAPEIESANVFLPHEDLHPWVKPFVDEWSIFPNGLHDDTVAAGAQALLRWAKPTAEAASGRAAVAVGQTSYWRFGAVDDRDRGEDDDDWEDRA
jgi:predicted phage terminase large subunit-like protein